MPQDHCQPEYYEPSLYDIPGEVQTLSRSNLVSRDYRDDIQPMINHYVRNKMIGQGRHGRVWLCYKVNPKLSKDHKHRRVPVALKEISRLPTIEDKHQLLRENAMRHNLPTTGHNVVVDKPSAEPRIRKEIAIMKKCRHPHIVRLLEVIDDRMESRIYLVMEYQAGGEVKWRYSDYVPALTVDQTKRIMRDVILGVEYLHFQGIIHRDIKPANLLWSADRRTVKIADFGTSHFSYAQRLAMAERYGVEAEQDPLFVDDSPLGKAGVGTPAFLAPELVWSFREASSDDDPPPIGKAIDIWCLGVTLFCLLFGGVPFIPPDTGAVFSAYPKYAAIANQDFEVYETMGADKIPSGGRHPTDETSEGFHILHLLDHLLTKDPRMRIVLEEVKKYPWFTRDLPNPEKWMAVTSPVRIEVNDDDTSTAISSVRFSWRWGIPRSINISSLWKGVRMQRSRDESSLRVPNEKEPRSINPIQPNKSTSALPIPAIPGRLRSKRRSSDSTRSRSPLAVLTTQTRKSHTPRGSASQLTSPGGSEIFNHNDRSAAKRFLSPWKSLKGQTSASLAPPNSVPESTSFVRRMHTLPGRASLAVGENMREHANATPCHSSDLTAAKRASSWGDKPFLDLSSEYEEDPRLDSTVLEVGAGGVEQRVPSASSRPFATPRDPLLSCESDTSYGDSWIMPGRLDGDDDSFPSDDDDEPLTFATSQRRRDLDDFDSSSDEDDM